MRIFVAGASGEVGKRLVPLLVANGHEVVGTTRSTRKVNDLRALGAEPVVLDVREAEAVGRVVSEAAPDVVVHQATALSDLSNLRDLDVSYGVGFRFHSNSAFVARLDLAFSREGFIPLLRFEHAF